MQKLLLYWFKENKRDLPWRTNPDWYKTFLSEIILQQTTVVQGWPYFQKFLKKYPNINSLALANEHDVLHLWAGLGYYARARNMLKAAKIISQKYNGKFPQDYKTALSLPGIGPYSASAILSISFNLPFSVMDGNVIRVISRIFAIKDDTRDPATLKFIKEKADSLLDKSEPGNFNEAMMELGATICLPSKPKCSGCPIHKNCSAYKRNLVDRIPYKSKPAKKKKKYNIVGVVMNKSKICIVRRPGTGFLAGLWEFPLIEVKTDDFSKINITDHFKKMYGLNVFREIESPKMRQTYSHIDLKFIAVTLRTGSKTILKNSYVESKWVKFEELENFAIHNGHKKIIEWLKLSKLITKSEG
ncbi:MAG: A/G-specific adenine glycosylase [Calditrichaeota bacterium]|nr:MAG: A/G-specific adenine glycosylase [Calditrichota bacterium]MBL1205972.1 A/G-specific adenine glycosylase [Calditrichota bacterium]NOG45800.1 A/G-specific adenine glycosylase [Calditrichota bacterium]